MEFFPIINGQIYAENVTLNQIAQEIGTPTYIYSASAIRAQYDTLSGTMAKILPKDKQPLLCYACKANSHLAILTLLQKRGSGLEIVSHGELKRGLAAGFDPQKIVSTGVGKSAIEIADLIKAGIHQINVESLPELVRIGQISSELQKNISVVFRLNPDVMGGSHDKNSTGRKDDKFGMDKAQIMQAFEMARAMNFVTALGLSMHIGSQVFTVDSFRTAFEKLPEIVSELRGGGHTISRLDIGGGFPIRYENEPPLDLMSYANWVKDIILPLDTEIIMEPGRFIVGNAGILLTRVEYVKDTTARKFLIVDAAMNDLIRPTLYDAYHGISPVTNHNAPTEIYDVVGPVCETGDTFTRQRPLPAMTQGDLCIIQSAGAYGFMQAGNYNTRCLPAEVLVNGDTFSVIRARQTHEDIFKTEKIPDWI